MDATIHARGLGLRHERATLRGRRRRPPLRPGGRNEAGDGPRPEPGIHDIDLTCHAGEVLGLLGPNGAGKSTLLRVLATAVPPDTGELRLLGQNALPPTPALRRRIGFAGDEPVHLEPLSGRDGAIFFARAAGVPAATARSAADALLDRFGLAADAHRPAGAYSYGMRRKLLLVQALVHSPEILLLDEPTLGLDPDARRTLDELIGEAAGRGATVVLATQDVHHASATCHRVLFLDRGRAVLEGEPAKLLADLGNGALIEIDVDGAAPEALPVPATHVISARDQRIRIRSDHGSAALPDICARLVRAGTTIRAIRIREPDLRDVFATLTGRPDHEWLRHDGPPAEPTR